VTQFRKKPVVIDAVQWDGISDLENGMVNRGDRETTVHTERGGIKVPAGWGLIPTLEGPHLVQPGDWVITGVKGERYPCKPDVFAATYEPLRGDDGD